MNPTGISQFNQARIEWAIRLRYSPMPEIDMQWLASQLNAFRIGELRTVGKTWEIMMERDAELLVNSDKRKADAAGLEWQIVSDGSIDGDKHAAALQYFYDNLSATKALDQDSIGSVDELVYQTMSALDYYYSAHEMLLRIDNPSAKEVTAEFRHTPLWFLEARRGYLGYLKHIFDMYGQPCIAGEWLTAVNLGWMRPLTMAYAAKWFSMTDWLIFCRRYGSGFLEGITDAQKDSTEWNDASMALNTLANEGAILHNKSVEFKFLDQQAKNQLPFQPVTEMIDRLYAKCYRGVDMATGSRGAGSQHNSGGNSGGKNPVGASVQKEESGIFQVRDAKWVTGVFNERIDRPAIRYLFNQEPRAWFVLVPPLDDASESDLEVLQGLVPMGFRVMLKEVYQKFRWSIPEKGEPCLEQPAAPVATMPEEPQGEEPADGKNPKPGTQKTETPAQPERSEPPKLEKEKADPNGHPTATARTNENTPIGAGADPARNPGLNPNARAQGPSRQMPDTQVDSGSFWSRAGLAPRGADGQTLPMPSLGYAVPNQIVARHSSLVTLGLGNSRAAQALRRQIKREESVALANVAEDAKRKFTQELMDKLAPVLVRVEKIAKIEDADSQRAAVAKLIKDFPVLQEAIEADDSTSALTPELIKSFLEGLNQGTKPAAQHSHGRTEKIS